MADTRTHTRFPCLITVATQEDLDNPEWPAVAGFLRDNYDRIRVVISRRTHPKEEYRGLVYHRLLTDEVLLKEVVRIASTMVSTSHPAIVIQDALVCAGKPAQALLNAGFVKSFHQGNAWAATGQALRMQGLEPQGIEDGVLRWFALAENTVKQMYGGTSPVPANIPFEQPVWSGWVANWLQSRIMESRYHDVTALHTIASWMPPTPDADLSGYGVMTFNPPTRSYVKDLNEVIAVGG